MCSITGLVTNNPSEKYVKMFIRTLVNAEERGRDGFGVSTLETDYKSLSTPHSVESELYKAIKPGRVMLNNDRAEPTTEFIKNKTINDTQPFIYEHAGRRIIVSHNGTIANDKELMQEHNIRTTSYIDSSVLPELVSKFGVLGALQRVKGSYAMAIYIDGKVWLACNYKPIYIKRMKDALLFSSLDTYMRTDWSDNIIRQEPYTALEIDVETLDVKIHDIAFHRAEKAKSKVLVICSGGLDSAVTATYYVRQGSDVTLLHFTYGCRAEKKEVDAIQRISQDLGCDYKFIDMSTIFKADIKGSPLLQEGADVIMNDRKGERGAELAYEWVPARNLVFYSLALAYAEAHGYDIIALGNNLEESGAYPDNEMIFARLFNDIIPNAVNVDVHIKVEQPVGNLMKHEIVALGVELDAPFADTWSCYESGAVHCGKCGPCYMRKKAFEMNNLHDPVFPL